MDSNQSRARNRERTGASRAAFGKTLDAYRNTLYLHPSRAMNLDATAAQSRTLGPVVIEFRADVESAVTHALRNNPELHDTFSGLLDEEPTDPKLALKVADKCGTVFVARQLQPRQYFKAPIRKGRVGRPV